jgi:hypothetical protein
MLLLFLKIWLKLTKFSITHVQSYYYLRKRKEATKFQTFSKKTLSGLFTYTSCPYLRLIVAVHLLSDLNSDGPSSNRNGACLLTRTEQMTAPWIRTAVKVWMIRRFVSPPGRRCATLWGQSFWKRRSGANRYARTHVLESYLFCEKKGSTST